MEHSLLAVWTLAFSLGIMHAFDADHVLAVSTLGKTRPSRRSIRAFCTHWALGHGMTLMTVSIAVLVMGVAVPTTLSEHAELLVAILLIVLGVLLLFNIYREAMATASSTTPCFKPAKQSCTEQSPPPPRKRALAIGMLHGMAGSAPLLAVIPLGQMESSWQALIYLLLFSLGVVVAMFAFAGMLNGFYTHITRNNVFALKLARTFLALLALSIGILMLQGM